MFELFKKPYVINEVISSYKLVEDQSISSAGEATFSLAHKKLDALAEQVSDYISQNSLKVPEDQKLISCEVIRLIHDKRFFGGYDEAIKSGEGQISNLQYEIERLEKKPELTKPELAELAKLRTKRTESRADFVNYYDSRGNSLAEMKKDTLVCREQAAIASIVLHKVGIPNDLCLDISHTGRSAHAFVQIHNKGDIVEATDPINPYRENLSGGSVINGDVVITREPEWLGTKPYGVGDFDKKDLKLLKEKNHSEQAYREVYEKDFNKAMLNYELLTVARDKRNKEPAEMTQPVSVSDALVRAEADIFKHDRPKKFLGLVTEKRDGVISMEERLKMEEEKTGGKLSANNVKQIKKIYADSNDSIFDETRSLRNTIRKTDLDKDGYITPKEFEQAVSAISKDYTEFWNKPMDPKNLQARKEILQEIVYGRN